MALTMTTSVPSGATDGDDLTLLADKTSSSQQSVSSKMNLKLKLTGGTSATYTLYVMDWSGDWYIAGETGNLGIVGGGALPTGANYCFPVEDIGSYKRVCLVKTADVGGVTTTASLEEVVETVKVK